jgi:hypothetical protein
MLESAYGTHKEKQKEDKEIAACRFSCLYIDRGGFITTP